MKINSHSLLEEEEVKLTSRQRLLLENLPFWRKFLYKCIAYIVMPFLLASSIFYAYRQVYRDYKAKQRLRKLDKDYIDRIIHPKS
jgi:hypothetical protein